MAKKKKETSNQLEVQNAAKTLFANIRFMSVDDPIRTIVVTSSIPNEGKTTTAVHLAQAIVTSGKSTLLVECDLRRRSLASELHLRASTGWYALLTDEVTLAGAVVETPTPNLYFLDVEPSIPNPADLIASKRFARLARQLAERFEYVIYDTPPVGTFVDAAILSTLVDGVVMVVRPNAVKRSELVHAYEQLQKADAKVIGTCATFVEGTGSEYYYAYYTSDGDRIRPGSRPMASTQEITPALTDQVSMPASWSFAGRHSANAGAGRTVVPGENDASRLPPSRSGRRRVH